MPPHAKGAVIACIGLIGIMTFLPPAMFGGKEDPLGKFVYDYQTLITGFAAVAAAFLTIQQMRGTDKEQGNRHSQMLRQMQVTDQEQAIRHDELVWLNMRPDALRMERLLIPQFEHLRSIAIVLDDVARQLEEADHWPEQQCAVVVEHLEQLFFYPHAIEAILVRPVWQEQRELFGGRLEFELGLFRTNLGFFLERITAARNAVPPLPPYNVIDEDFEETEIRRQQREIFNAHLEAIPGPTIKLHYDLGELMDRLTDLAKTYRVVL